MNDYPTQYKTALVAEVKRRLIEEGQARIEQCLNQLNDQEIWHRPNQNSNSIGNLVLHLCGNVRQWILTGLAGQPDIRERDLEFDEQGPVPVETLIKQLAGLMQEVSAYLDEMPAETILEVKNVQGFEETGLTVLVHVVEHFSYHVGQITYITKALKDIDTQYYGGLDLNIKD